MPFEWTLLIPAGACTLAAAVMGRTGLKYLRRGRPLTFFILMSAGLSTAFVGFALVAAWLNLSTYSRVTHEQPVANIHVVHVDSNIATVRLETPELGGTRIYRMPTGDWQLDARVLKWAPWANLLGLDSRYRLERLADRPPNLGAPNRLTAFELRRGASEWIDVWALARSGWLPGVDTVYGSSVYGPLAANAAYSIRLSQTGLLSRSVQR